MHSSSLNFTAKEKPGFVVIFHISDYVIGQGHGEHFMLLLHTYMYLSRDDTKLENQMPKDIMGINLFYCH